MSLMQSHTASSVSRLYSPPPNALKMSIAPKRTMQERVTHSPKNFMEGLTSGAASKLGLETTVLAPGKNNCHFFIMQVVLIKFKLFSTLINYAIQLLKDRPVNCYYRTHSPKNMMEGLTSGAASKLGLEATVLAPGKNNYELTSFNFGPAHSTRSSRLRVQLLASDRLELYD